MERAALTGQGVSEAIAPGARVAVLAGDTVEAVRAFAALDGQVAAMLLLSRALVDEVAVQLARAAGCDVIVSDREIAAEGLSVVPLARMFGSRREAAPQATRWLMTTSGTTGLPKIVPHTLGSLARSVYRFGPGDVKVWGLLYDPTRFAGLQVVLQALIGGGRLVAVDTAAPLADQVAELVAQGCTHLSATPTLWRRLMMVPGYREMDLRQVTLGGEIADRGTLNALKAAFPKARITHIYASTEAGVGFSVTDGQAGFPASYLEAAPQGVRLKVDGDMLWLRPTVSVLTGDEDGIEVDAEGFVRSGDLVEVSEGRVTFLGRENGLINIGGVKVYPETVEAVVAGVDGVALVQVTSKKSPVTGALVVAQIVLAAGADQGDVRARVQESCRAQLPREAVPAILRFVDGFETNAAGKLLRPKT